MSKEFEGVLHEVTTKEVGCPIILTVPTCNALIPPEEFRFVKVEETTATDKEVYATGAQRDTQDGKLLYGEISPHFETRVALILTHGAARYGRGNWRKGIPFQRVVDSLLRHVKAFQLGDESEDHLAQAACNIMFLMHYQEMIAQGKLPKELNDLEDHN